MSSPGYRDVLRRLTALDADAAGHRDEAERWYDGRVAAADDKVRAAEQSAREAEQAVREARRDLEAVDARAAGLWSNFVHDVGPRAERFGRTVPPPTVPRQRDRDAEEYLQEATTAAAYTSPTRPLTGGSKVLFGVFGFVGGAVGLTAYRLLRWAGQAAGGDWATALPVLALITMLLGPVLAALAAKKVADRRGVDLDLTAVATVLITAALTVALAYTAFPTQ
jgi:hypothetical protein